MHHSQSTLGPETHQHPSQSGYLGIQPPTQLPTWDQNKISIFSHKSSGGVKENREGKREKVTKRFTCIKELYQSTEIEKEKLIAIPKISALKKWQIQPRDGVVRTEVYNWNNEGKTK